MALTFSRWQHNYFQIPCFGKIIVPNGERQSVYLMALYTSIREGGGHYVVTPKGAEIGPIMWLMLLVRWLLNSILPACALHTSQEIRVHSGFV